MKKDLTKGSIIGHLWLVSSPMIISIFAGMSFNLVDTYFVGKLGVDELAALSFSFPIVLTILNLSIGLAIGTSSVLSRMLGEGKNEQVKILSTLVGITGVGLGVLLTTVGIYTIEPLFQFLGATEVQVELAKRYMVFAYPAMGIRLIAVSISGTYRANGITLIPSLSMLTATLFNFILDPILIFGAFGIPALGIEGAGLATLISNFLALLFEFYMGAFKYKFFTLSFEHLPKQKIQEIIMIAAPASIANALNPIALNVANFYISKQYSSLSVAGFGVATKIQFFSMIPILALSAAVGPIVGQNLGAGNSNRVNKTMKLSFNFCLIWGIVQAIILWFGGENLASLFTNNAESIEFCVRYLQIVNWTLFGYSIVIIGCAILNAINYPLRSFFVIFSRSLGLFVGFYYLLNYFGSEWPVIYSIALSNIIVGVGVGLYFKFGKIKNGAV